MRDGIDDEIPETRAIEPQLSELLRTCIHPPTLLLRVANIIRHDAGPTDPKSVSSLGSNEAKIDLPDINNRYATKLLLSDGQLMIQALLHRKLNVVPEATGIQVGDLLEVRKFVVKKARRTNGVGKVVYLGIEDCYFIRRSPEQANAEGTFTERELLQEASSSPKGRKRDIRMVDGEKREAETRPHRSNKRPHLSVAAEQDAHLVDETVDLLHNRNESISHSVNHVSNQEEYDDFEVLSVDEHQATLRRHALKELSNNVPSCPLQTTDNTSAGPRNGNLSEQVEQIQLQTEKPVNSPQQITQPFHPQSQAPVHAFQLSQQQNPDQIKHQSGYSANPKPPIPSPHIPTQPKSLPVPPLHTLASLRADKTLPTRNYAVTVLAYISWTGTTLIHRPGSPFPPKRHVKLTDSSLAQSRPVSRHEALPTATAAPRRQNGDSGSRPASRSGITDAMNNPAAPSTLTFTPQNRFQDAVTLAVFADASTFKPIPGTLALFSGIVMQRLGNGDVILNAYARVKEQTFVGRHGAVGDCGKSSGWFVDDLDLIKALGYEKEMLELQLWWDEQGQRR